MDGTNDPSDSTPLPYTASPFELIKSEAKLTADILWNYPASLLGILQPVWSTKPEDELCLSEWKNVRSLILHLILIITQVIFILAVIYGLIMPVPAGAYVGGIFIAWKLNFYFCKLLNGSGDPQISTTDLKSFPSHEKECWIFINGVSVGRDWFQSNLNTLSLIFRRPIIGVHNITYGIIFDVFECLIQRDSSYPTNDIRTGYAQVKKNLLDDRFDKIVVIAHSQGGIEVGAIFDWLLDDLPASKLAKLEIYTFGSAANHFNNPSRDCKANSKRGVVRHIEHYTNCGEFVSRFGILGFIRPPMMARSTTKPIANANADAGSDGASADASQDNNRFKGRLFKRNARGHMLNQHYLAHLFTREKYTLDDGHTVCERVKDHNPFMNSEAVPWDGEVDRTNLGFGNILDLGSSGVKDKIREEGGWLSMMREDGLDLSGAEVTENGKVGKGRKPKDLSRLWLYRNGKTPPDDDKDEEEGDGEYHHRRHFEAEQSQEEDQPFRQRIAAVATPLNGVAK